MSIENIRLSIAEFLQTPILINNYVHLDFWSLVHIMAGLLIIYLIYKLFKKHKSIIKNRYFIGITILIGWELFEFFLYGVVKTSYFLPERTTDTFWDLLVGIIGIIIMDKLINKKYIKITSRK